MGYMDLLRAQRKSGKPPSMTKLKLSRRQKELAAKGICIDCSDRPAEASSYLCADCQAKDTIEDIREEIKGLRAKILKHD